MTVSEFSELMRRIVFPKLRLVDTDSKYTISAKPRIKMPARTNFFSPTPNHATKFIYLNRNGKEFYVISVNYIHGLTRKSALDWVKNGILADHNS